MKNTSAELYKDIIEIFSNKLKNIINEFINNIDKNKEVTKFFNSCNILNEEKELKRRGQINKYIKQLREKGEQSAFNILIKWMEFNQN